MLLGIGTAIHTSYPIRVCATQPPPPSFSFVHVYSPCLCAYNIQEPVLERLIGELRAWRACPRVSEQLAKSFVADPAALEELQAIADL